MAKPDGCATFTDWYQITSVSPMPNEATCCHQGCCDIMTGSVGPSLTSWVPRRSSVHRAVTTESPISAGPCSVTTQRA
jgi:hypothetical protein